MIEVEEEDNPPELEEVDLEEEKLKKLEQTKEQKQKEWLQNVINENSKTETQEPFIPWDENCKLPEPTEEAIHKRQE